MSAINRDTSVETLAGIVSAALDSHKITAVLSGGAAVSLYTNNRYESQDLDFITSAETKDIEKALEPLGFRRESRGRHFKHENTDYVLEFPTGPLAVGHRLIVEWSRLETGGGIVQILTPTQMVMDRLSAYFHWNDPQSLEQALWIADEHPIDMQDLEEWAMGEDSPVKFATFRRRAKL